MPCAPAIETGIYFKEVGAEVELENNDQQPNAHKAHADTDQIIKTSAQKLTICFNIFHLMFTGAVALIGFIIPHAACIHAGIDLSGIRMKV